MQRNSITYKTVQRKKQCKETYKTVQKSMNRETKEISYNHEYDQKIPDKSVILSKCLEPGQWRSKIKTQFTGNKN